MEFLEAKTPQEIKKFIDSHDGEITVVAMYAMNARHYVWYTLQTKKINRSK